MDAETSYRALTQVHPRSAQVLVAHFIAQTPNGDGRSFTEFATFYGVPEASAKVLLWRAVREFEAALRGAPVGRPLPHEQELREADALHVALEGSAPGPTIEALRALTTNAPALRQRIRDAERAEVESPSYARETWLRRIAIVVVLALSAWFYWKDDLTRWWHQQTVEAPGGTRP